PGVVGGLPEAEAFAVAWCARTGNTARRVMGQGIYSLTEVLPVPAVAGTPRTARPDDLNLVAGWIQAFQDEVVPDPLRSDRHERDLARLDHPEALPGQPLERRRVVQIRDPAFELRVLLLQFVRLPLQPLELRALEQVRPRRGDREDSHDEDGEQQDGCARRQADATRMAARPFPIVPPGGGGGSRRGPRAHGARSPPGGRPANGEPNRASSPSDP